MAKSKKVAKSKTQSGSLVPLSLKVDGEMMRQINTWREQAQKEVPILGEVSRTDAIKFMLRYALGLSPGQVIADNLRSA